MARVKHQNIIKLYGVVHNPVSLMSLSNISNVHWTKIHTGMATIKGV